MPRDPPTISLTSCSETRDQRPQHVLQRLEPRLEMAPLVEPILEDGLTDLLGACSSHAAPRLVVLEALRLEFEAAEIEQPADIALQVLDDFFVLHPQYLSGQHGFPVRHE